MDFDDSPPPPAAGSVRAKHGQRIRAVGTAVTLIGTLSFAAPGTVAVAASEPEPSASTSMLRVGLPEREPLRPVRAPVAGADEVTVYVDQSSVGRDSAAGATTVVRWNQATAPGAAPAVPAPLRRLTRELSWAVERFAPGAAMEPVAAPRSGSYAILGGHSAALVLRDRQGDGSIAVAVSRRLTVAPPAAAWVSPINQARQGPHGEQLAVHSSAVDGRVTYTVQAWSGQTFIEVTTDNAARRGGTPRPTPFLTVDQLITLACTPALRLH